MIPTVSHVLAALAAGVVVIGFPLLAQAQSATGAATVPATAASSSPADERFLPDWLTISGEARIRYETLDNQFRAGGRGGDQALAMRTTVLAEAKFTKISLGLELHDSRLEFNDTGSPTTNSMVNALDVLQAYAAFDMGETGFAKALGHTKARLKLGRQTLDIGGRRIFERVDMSNVILNFTGAYWLSTNARGDSLHALAVVPVGRRPVDFASVLENEIQPDREEWSRVILGLQYGRANMLPQLAPGILGEVFVYSLRERDTQRTLTPNRDYLQPGFRLFRAPKKNQWDFEIDTSWRTGSRRASSAVTETRDLKVNAFTTHAHFGYTFDMPWQPRLALDWDFATGDRDPTDGNYDQFERLFGGRRTDLGNTGIYGPLTPANINAPGGRIELRPNARWDMRLAFKVARLEEARDVWVVARVQDRTGQSGSFIGHMIDGRTRYWLQPDKLRLEVGASVFLPGRFAKSAPNAALTGTAHFGFVALTRIF
jgi:hypothetical protein